MIPEEVFQTLQKMISDQFGVSVDEIEMTTSLEDDLGADSLELAEMAMAMEEQFGLEGIEEKEDQLKQLKTVGDCVRFIIAETSR